MRPNPLPLSLSRQRPGLPPPIFRGRRPRGHGCFPPGSAAPPGFPRRPTLISLTNHLEANPLKHGGQILKPVPAVHWPAPPPSFAVAAHAALAAFLPAALRQGSGFGVQGLRVYL